MRQFKTMPAYYLWLTVEIAACAAPKAEPDSDEGASQEEVDSDGDGYGSEDCDDSNPDVHPGASEVCDGVDNNCDGVVDDSDSVPPELLNTYFLDSDGDGYGDSTQPIQACAAPSMYTATAGDCEPDDASVSPGMPEVCGNDRDDDCSGNADDIDADGDGFGPAGCSEPSDCDDSDGSVFPGAEDAWYDGVDSDCEGNDDFDADEDGVAGAAGGGADCDDSNPFISPDLEEVCGNGLDDNCSGDADGCVPAGEMDITEFTTKIQGATSRDYMGISMGVGDTDGDGFDDVLAGARDADNPDRDAGAVYLFPGPLAGTSSPTDAIATVTGEAEYDYIGEAAGLSDLDGDGFADIFIDVRTDDTAASNAGAVAVFYGPISGVSTHSQADALVTGEVASAYLGHAVVDLGDVDNDGADEISIAEPYIDTATGDRLGRISLVSGTLSGTVAVSAAAETQIIGEWDGHVIHAERTGDVDGDGIEDIVVSVPDARTRGATGGAVLVFRGPPNTLMYAEDADLRLVETSEGAQLGSSVSGGPDADGDGLADLAIGSYNYDNRSGRAFLCTKPLDVATSATNCSTRVDAIGSNDAVGIDVLLMEDGMGGVDLHVGAYGAASTKGEVYSFRGVSAGVVDRNDADLVLVGADSSDSLGFLLTAAGDVDGDGAEDLWVSAIHAEPSVVTLVPGGWL